MFKKNTQYIVNVCLHPTPSPTYSSSSLTISGGPPTLLQLGFTGSPYIYAHPLLLQRPSGIHSALDFSHTSVLKCDVSLDPSTVTSQYPSMLLDVLEEPATNPPLPSITIKSLQLPWHIIATPSKKNGSCVTVGDVLAAIYNTLRTQVTAVEITELEHDAQTMVKAAYKRRYEGITDALASEKERKKGMKRVDYLGGKTTFMGLSSTSQGPDVWELNVSQNPRDNAGIVLFSPFTFASRWGGC